MKPEVCVRYACSNTRKSSTMTLKDKCRFIAIFTIIMSIVNITYAIMENETLLMAQENQRFFIYPDTCIIITMVVSAIWGAVFVSAVTLLVGISKEVELLVHQFLVYQFLVYQFVTAMTLKLLCFYVFILVGADLLIESGFHCDTVIIWIGNVSFLCIDVCILVEVFTYAVSLRKKALEKLHPPVITIH